MCLTGGSLVNATRGNRVDRLFLLQRLSSTFAGISGCYDCDSGGWAERWRSSDQTRRDNPSESESVGTWGGDALL